MKLSIHDGKDREFQSKATNFNICLLFLDYFLIELIHYLLESNKLKNSTKTNK